MILDYVSLKVCYYLISFLIEIEDKEIKLEYNNYKSDKFGRIFAYPILPDGTNVSIELVKKGLAELVIYQKRKPFIHQAELLKAQAEAKNRGLGIWSNKN